MGLKKGLAQYGKPCLKLFFLQKRPKMIQSLVLMYTVQ